MIVGKFSTLVSCLSEKKRALEDRALTQIRWNWATSKNGRRFRRSRVAIRSALAKELVLSDCFYVKSKHIFQFLFNW